MDGFQNLFCQVFFYFKYENMFMLLHIRMLMLLHIKMLMLLHIKTKLQAEC
jgi:hypothetical protein